MSEAREAAIPGFVQLHGLEGEAPAATLSAAAIPAAKKSFFEQLLDTFDYPSSWEDELDKGDPHGPAVVAARHAARAAAHAKGQLPLGSSPGELAEQREQADLLREIVGDPFRAVALAPAVLRWRDGSIPKIAQIIYAERAFDRLPVLADALEEAGCTDSIIVAHCRGPGPHVRGCWVVDLVLGK